MVSLFQKIFLISIFCFIFLDSKYSRKNWGNWEKIKKKNIRHLVLAQESIVPVVWKKNKVIQGKWLDLYTGKVYTNAKNLDIDHLVPLFEAWQSGGCLWNSKKKKKYYNTTTNTNHLIAVSSKINRKKKAQDLSEWLPDKNKIWYTKAWVEIKQNWGLSVDIREAKTIYANGISTNHLLIEPEEKRCNPKK